MAARRRCHHAEAPRPTWIVTIKAAPPAPVKKPGPPAYSPVLPSPSVWQNAQKGRADGGGVPASPRIGCMGQVKGGRRRCSSARRAAARGKGSGFCRRGLAGLLSGLFGRRRRAYSKVRDVASESSSSSGSSRGARATCPFDRPLPVPVVRRPTMEENAPSLWERRRGGGKALEGLQLT